MKAKGSLWAALIWALLVGFMLLAWTGACSRGAAAADRWLDEKCDRIGGR